MGSIWIPEGLRAAVQADDDPDRCAWLAALPGQVEQIGSDWALELGEAFVPGGQCAWAAPVRNQAGEELVLKVGWRHREAEHEADALRLWSGDGAARCLAARRLPNTTALLLERCTPGTQLKRVLPETEQDVVLARLLRRLWKHRPPPGHPFGSLQQMCDQWAEKSELALADSTGRNVDRGLALTGIAMLRELPGTADETVLLCTDLHAENVLASRREPWLVIDPKPYVGDPAYDAVQHMLNCGERLAADPTKLAYRMADLLEVDRERVRLWLFARCAQKSLADPALLQPARQLAR